MKKIITASFLSLIVILTCLIPVFVSSSDSNILENDLSNTELTVSITPFGYDDDAIYYDYNHPYIYNNISSNFPSTIRVTEHRSGRIYAGMLRFTGKYTCYGSNCNGQYTGTLYLQ